MMDSDALLFCLKAPPQQPEIEHRELAMPNRRLLKYLRDVWRHIPLTLKILTALTGALATYLELAPSVYVDPPDTPADYLMPFDQPFVLKNDNRWPAYWVKVACGPPTGIGFMPASGASSFESGKPFSIKTRFILASFSDPRLSPHDPRPFSCGTWILTGQTGQPSITTYAWTTIKVTFRLIPFLPCPEWICSQVFPFEAHLLEDGKFHWSRRALPMDTPVPTPIR